jgi:sigma-B regulation protein RsbU (phosphoserine phosphatase)
MVMVGARATLRTLAGAHTCGARVFEALAQGMFDDLTRTERFITAAGIVLRPQDLAVEVINAGHAEVLQYVARERTVRTIGGAGPIFGFVPGACYEAQPVLLEPGDCLLLYTDGVTESTNGEGEMFGEDRLVELLGQTAKFGSRAVVDAVLTAVRQFEGPQGRGDDVTVVAVRAMPRQGLGS